MGTTDETFDLGTVEISNIVRIFEKIKLKQSKAP